MNVNVKICGIRSIDSALAAIDAGADFIGLNFVLTSKRKVSEEKAAEIIGTVKGQIKIVGVFQNAEIAFVNGLVKKLNLDFVQLHGLEGPAYCARMQANVIKSFALQRGVAADALLETMQAFDVPFFLLDREVQGKGGVVHAETAHRIAQECKVFLAGGLNPENVAEAVAKVKPFAVDVAGGIETGGKEDFEKIKEFIRNAKAVRHSGK